MSFVEFESGLIDRYRGVIEDAWFAVDANYNATATLLFLKIKVDESTIEGEIPQNFNGYVEERLSVGGGWASFDQGKTIEDPDRPDRTKFNQNSLYVKFMQKMAELGALPVLEARSRAGLNARHAAAWIGFDLTWGPTEFNYGKDIGKKTRTFPENYHGVVEGAGGGNSVAPPQAPMAQAPPQTAPAAPVEQAPLPQQEAPVQPVAAAAPAAEDDVMATLDPTMIEALRNAKASTASHGEFLDKAMGLTGVADNPTLVMALADEANIYSRL